MSNEYVTKEVTAIYNDAELTPPLNLAMAATWILGNLKGVNLKILDLNHQSSIADYFVLASAGNPTQASAMAEEIVFQMRNLGLEALSTEGIKHNTEWILLDFADVIVHIFHEPARTIYDLDQLYKNAINVEIPESYYFSTPQTSTKSVDKNDLKNYF